jgi:hypothetical protein
MTAAELCPARRHDGEDGECVVCLLDARQVEATRGAWTFICWRCWDRMLDGRALRKEWELAP